MKQHQTLNSYVAWAHLTAVAIGLSWLTACGGGVPVEVRIDEYTFALGVDDALASLSDSLAQTGLFPQGGALPEIWPDALPDITYDLSLKTAPMSVDLTPPADAENADKYAKINKASEVVSRIEINDLVLRVEQSSLTLPIPELTLQVADAPDANPDDRRAWFTIGKIPGAEPGFVGDLAFEWVPGGETFFNTQLSDDLKEFAVRGVGNISFDTAQNPNLPRGIAKLRLIVVATFFVEPTQGKDAL